MDPGLTIPGNDPDEGLPGFQPRGDQRSRKVENRFHSIGDRQIHVAGEEMSILPAFTSLLEKASQTKGDCLAIGCDSTMKTIGDIGVIP
jgi:hypothetical protein